MTFYNLNFRGVWRANKDIKYYVGFQRLPVVAFKELGLNFLTNELADFVISKEICIKHSIKVWYVLTYIVYYM